MADSTVGRSVAEERARRYSGIAFWGVMEVERSEGAARRESMSRPERGFTVSFLRPFALGGTGTLLVAKEGERRMLRRGAGVGKRYPS